MGGARPGSRGSGVERTLRGLARGCEGGAKRRGEPACALYGSACAVRRAIVAFEAGPADFSDYFIRESSREASALPVMTFDERFARGADVELVPEK